MSSIFVPMTKATGFGPLPDILEQHVGSRAVHLAFQTAGLPLEIIECPDTRIPLEAMQNLFGFSARAADDRCFGFSVGQKMSPASFGLWMQYCTQASTLEIALRRSANAAISISQVDGLPLSQAHLCRSGVTLPCQALLRLLYIIQTI